MAKADILNILYSKERSPLEFKFDSMFVPPMYNYLTQQDILALNKIATSIKYSSRIEMKYKAIDDILRARGFKRLSAGTNRVVYSYLEDTRFVLKVAIDRVGINDNPNEYRNQFLLKPFITKIFEVSPCGTVAMVERVQPILSKAEFMSVADDVFDLLNTSIIGKYVLEDIGTKFFMNWGLRVGYGPVLLDYPYLFELDGNKLFCNKKFQNGEICDGLIDYDDGFNKLYCTKCGKDYLATELKKNIENKIIIQKGSDDENLQVSLMCGDELVQDYSEISETNVIIKK